MSIAGPMTLRHGIGIPITTMQDSLEKFCFQHRAERVIHWQMILLNFRG